MYRVLLVDDEEIVTQGLTRFVRWEDAGFEVACAVSSVESALEFLENEPVDLVITDVLMPVKTGLDLISELNKKYPAIKTVLLSGYSEFEYVQQALRLGALDYLTKPVNFSMLKALLKKIRDTLDEEKRETAFDKRVRETLAQTLIMNYANGFPFNEERVRSFLNVNSPVTVVRMASRGREKLKKELALRFKDAFKPCHTVFPMDEEMMAVLEGEREPSKLYAELEKFAHSEEKRQPLCIGVSERQSGYRSLRAASTQAIRAMRYQSARSGKGVMLYEWVREMYLGFGKEAEAAVREMTELIAAPESRLKLNAVFSSMLSSLEAGEDFSLDKARRFCVQTLVELDAPIQQLKLQDYPRHELLSETLMDVMGAENLRQLGAAMSQFLRRLTDHIARMDEKKATGELIDRVKAYINAHFAEKLTLVVLSEAFYISPVYLSRLFKRKTGVNFVEYLTSVRLEKAKEYLRDPKLKIYHVSEMVGYENPRYFARLFKKATGLTPQDYRDRL